MNATISIHIDQQLYEQAQHKAEVEHRSVAEQNGTRRYLVATRCVGTRVNHSLNYAKYHTFGLLFSRIPCAILQRVIIADPQFKN